MLCNYYDDLLELLEICLKYNLGKSKSTKSRFCSNSDESDSVNGSKKTANINSTPHSNIVSDVMNCILLVIWLVDLFDFDLFDFVFLLN
jgi:hypothetical protein